MISPHNPDIDQLCVPFILRVSSNLFNMMYLKSKLSLGSDADNPYQKFFSTHPLDKERAGKPEGDLRSKVVLIYCV